MKYTIPIAVAFMALSLGAFMARPSWEASLSFVTASALFGFLCWLERNRTDEFRALREEFAQVKNEVSNVAIRLGWGG